MKSEIIPLAVYAGVSSLSFIPAVSKIVSPVTTIALTILSGVITRGLRQMNLKAGGDKDFKASYQTSSRVHLVKSSIILIALPILGPAKGIATIGAVHLADTLANCIVNHLPAAQP